MERRKGAYLAARHELHDQEEVLLVLVDVEKLHDVRVVHLHQDVDFVLEANAVFICEAAPSGRVNEISLVLRLPWASHSSRRLTWK